MNELHKISSKPVKSFAGGITEENRALLAEIHRQTSGPFGADEAARIMNVDIARSRRLLAYWAARGWLARVRRGLYITVPLEARLPSERREDAWILANALFSPGYVGGWSACEHWGLTEQIFKDVVVFTARAVRDRGPTIQDTGFMIKTISKDKLFGTVSAWRREVRIQVSDPSRTVIDLLAYPKVGGGIRQASEMIAEYFTSDHRDDNKLIAYMKRFGNRAVGKRLGYVIESLQIAAPELLAYCLANVSSGYTKLDPGVTSKGRIVRRWNLAVNVALSA